jgi:hypothetical protein
VAAPNTFAGERRCAGAPGDERWVRSGSPIRDARRRADANGVISTATGGSDGRQARGSTSCSGVDGGGRAIFAADLATRSMACDAAATSPGPPGAGRDDRARRALPNRHRATASARMRRAQ